jgi:HPt (histidine-containing phosphotransfer) domain-containing protein
VPNPRTRLQKLCSRAERETDPQKLAGLLIEIDEILRQTLEEVANLLNEVEQVLKKREHSMRIH